MDLEKQTLLLEYLISASDTFAICRGIIKPHYFDPELRNAVTFIYQYYDNYSVTPEPEQIKAETGITLELKELTPEKLRYTLDEIETFCKKRAIECAVLSSPPLIEKGDYTKLRENITDAILVGLNKNLGLRYFEDPAERLKKLLVDNNMESTGWKQVDHHLFGGISRKQMILFAANSGGGKSMTLANLGLNFINKGMNVLYISLELDEDVIAQRYDTMITGVSKRDWKGKVSEIVSGINQAGKKAGILDIVQMRSGTTGRDIEAYLKEFYLHYKFMPDMLILDYLDKMSANEKVSADNVFEKDKRCAEQLRDIGVQHNMFIATASQLNRGAVNASTHDHSHIAGGISKINETDVFITISFSEAHQVAGEMYFHFLKTRNSDGVGKSVHLTWDSSHLRITDGDGSSNVDFNKIKSKESPMIEEESNNDAMMGFLNGLT